MRMAHAIVIAALAARMGWAADPQPAAAPQRDAAPKAAPKTSAAKQAPRSAQPALSDAQIEAVIRAKFAKSKINEDKFTVHVQGGVATIEGRTDVIQHKGVATRMAKTGGAIAVNNHIQISDAAKEKSAANLEQGRRRAQIKRGDARSSTPEPRQNH